MQHLIQAESLQIFNMLFHEQGHFYVCGDCTMAEDVYQTLKQIIQTHGGLSDKEVEAYMLTLRVSSPKFWQWENFKNNLHLGLNYWLL